MLSCTHLEFRRLIGYSVATNLSSLVFGTIFFSLKVPCDTLMIYHIMYYHKYALTDRIDPSEVGVIQIEGLKYIPGRNRANNTFALENRPKRSGTSQLGHNKGVNPTGRSTISQENYSYDFGQNYLEKND